jgi:hypothetical protein
VETKTIWSILAGRKTPQFFPMKRIARICACLVGIISVPAGELAFESYNVCPPPPAAPLFTTETGKPSLHSTATTYSIGDPSPEEQLYLEFINRARLNPPAEGVILANIKDPGILSAYQGFKIDLSLMQSQFAALGAIQPLAFNAKLATAARRHSLDMFNHVFQEHTGSDGSSPGDRITQAGYAGQAGENVYANAESTLYGHAGFEVDWGGPAENGGMQLPSGHRANIHNGVFREVGIGVVNGLNSAPGKVPIDEVGPQVVTQDFGTAQNSTPFITGVAYYDLNGNGFYDAGEGIGNVQVTVAGSNFQGVTARSGGYAVPVPTNGNYTVTFSGPGFEALSKGVAIIGSKNSKLDFTPVYAPPVVSGPPVASIGRDNAYLISVVAGASAFEGRSFQKIPAAGEGAENDSARLTVAQSGTYDVFQSLVVKSGSFAFHLVTPVDGARSQYITLSPTYLVNDNASLTFQSRVGFSTPDQHAQVQISTDNGANWGVVYNQNGNSDNPEIGWKQRTVSLANYAGKAIRIRFVFEFVRGVYVSSTDLSVGWLLDDIEFTNTQEIVNSQILPVTGNVFQFHPEVIGDFCLQARAKTGHDFLDWGPLLPVRSTPASGAPQLNLTVTRAAAGPVQFDVNVTAGTAPSKLTLESRDTFNTAWQSETLTFQPISSTLFRAALAPPNTGKTKFYRVRAE